MGEKASSYSTIFFLLLASWLGLLVSFFPFSFLVPRWIFAFHCTLGRLGSIGDEFDEVNFNFLEVR